VHEEPGSKDSIRLIPRRLHQIWIGPSPAPSRWMQTWRDAHSHWEYTIWDEVAIKRLGLKNARLFRRLCNIGRYDGASDVARAEILLRRGGVYIDADSLCLRPLDGAPFLESGFFAVQELQPFVDRLVNGAFMGAEAGHPILSRYVAALSRVKSLTPTWITTGPVLLTQVIGEDPTAEILPPWVFFDRTLQGEPVVGEEPYARHFWSSTAGREEQHPGASPYPGQIMGSIPETFNARTGVRSVVYTMFRPVKRVVRHFGRLLAGHSRD
jgi:inositol phosphorylceramide mannosyltransferase catalytic subunit